MKLNIKDPYNAITKTLTNRMKMTKIYLFVFLLFNFCHGTTQISSDLIEGYRSKVENPTPQLIDDLYGDRPGLTNFLKTVEQNPLLRHEMLLALQMESEAFYPHFYKTESEKMDRLRYLPFTYGPRIRSHFLNFIAASLRLNSDNIKQNLKSHWDVAVIGAGFHGALFANRIKAERPDASIIIIDKELLPSQHFYKGGHYFRMNNTLNEKDEGPSFQRDEKYNIPHTYGPVQVTDITGHRWPAAKLIAEVGRITLFASQADCLLNTEIISVAESNGRYLLKTDEGNTLSANKVVFATGLGKPKIPCSDEESRKLIETALANGDERIMTVERAFSLNSKINPLAQWKSHDIILVGFGNSALTFLEFLYSMGPDSCYQFESIQNKEVIKTSVITGSSVETKLRPRYSGLMSPIKEGQIKLFPGKMSGVKYLEDGRIEVFYDGKSLIGSRLILATGYSLHLENLKDFTPIKEWVADSKIPVPIAKKLKDQEIYVIGPAAGRDLVDPINSTNGVPLVEIGQAEAIPYTSILTETFAVKLAQALTDGEKSRVEFRTLEPDAESNIATLITSLEKKALVEEFVATSEEIPTELKAQMIQLFTFTHFDKLELKFYWEHDRLVVQGDHFKKSDIDWLAAEIRKNTLLLSLLAGYVSPHDTLTFSFSESPHLSLVTRNYNTAYVNTSNKGKKEELMNLFGKHDVKLFFAPTQPVSCNGSKIEKAVAKANFVADGIIVEDNTLEVEGVEIPFDQLESFIGKDATWTCYMCQKRGREIYLYRGVVIGTLVPKAGEHGFGFDPYFKPKGGTKTLAEEKLEKHNARALAIEDFLNNQVHLKISI